MTHQASAFSDNFLFMRLAMLVAPLRGSSQPNSPTTLESSWGKTPSDLVNDVIKIFWSSVGPLNVFGFPDHILANSIADIRGWFVVADGGCPMRAVMLERSLVSAFETEPCAPLLSPAWIHRDFLKLLQPNLIPHDILANLEKNILLDLWRKQP